MQKPIAKLLKVRDSVIRSIKVLKVLIIEEISMVENQFLERLNLLLQKILVSRDPFGGVQVIFVGDFHQLPPVKPFEFCLECGKEMVTLKKGGVCKQKGCQQKGKTPFQSGDKWAFKAPVWSKLGLRHVRLEQIHRQKEVRFQNILNKIANGTALTDEEWSALEAKKNLPANAFAVRLMSKRDKVDAFNNKELRNLNSESYFWTAYDCSYRVHSDPADRDQPKSREVAQTENEFKQSLRKEHRYPNELSLKVGAKVVLLSNLDFHAGLVNGSQGQVITFEKDGAANGDVARRTRPWEKRCRNFEELNHSYKPVVRFENGKVRTIEPDTKETTKAHPSGQFLVSRTQIPLALAWALSIHKSQGMTLQHVNVSSNDIFETGQLYVGLSRATTLDGLTVTGWSREQLVMDEDVLAFYKNTKWESLRPANLPRSSPKLPGKSVTQGPTENSTSRFPSEATPRRLPKNVDPSPRTTDEAANLDQLEPARSPLSSSDRSTREGPHETTTTPPNPSDETIPEPSTRERGFSPISLEHTAKKSPLEANPNASTVHKSMPKGPFERNWSNLAKTLDKTTTPCPSQKIPQRLTKPTDPRLFKVTKPMVEPIRPSIERDEPVDSSPLRQGKPIVIEVIDLVSSDDEGD
jgi:ATP-dependent DNA helicase PIF1